jgi:alpha-glucosidase (family GH31 glycosyl hydrolase)
LKLFPLSAAIFLANLTGLPKGFPLLSGLKNSTMKHIFTLLLLVSLTVAGQKTARKFEGFTKNGNQLELTVSDGKYEMRFYNANIAETTFIPTGENFNPESHAVVLKPENVPVQNSETTSTIEFATTGIEVHIQKDPFQISYFYNGKEILSEKNGYAKTDTSESINFNLDSSEALFGGGARVLGMNRRGNRLQLYNKAHYGYETHSELMNFTMPLVFSSKLYAVHFDNPAIGYLDLDSKKDNTLAYETISGRKTYQVIAGDSWQNLIENYTLLTGRQPLPPRWAFGNISSRFGYHSEQQAQRTIAKFRADKIPVDAIVFDLYWFGKEVKGTMGNLEVDRDSFPHFEKMVSDFNKDGVKTIVITEPFILTTSKKWQEAVDKNILATNKQGQPFTYDFYFGNTGLIDIFKPEGRDWFWDIYKGLAQKGVAGVWGDLGEPEVHPSDLQHATGSADQVHNIYGHNWAKLVYDGYAKDFPEQRPFILMRSGYSGSQRFGMIPWSGDVSRSWGGLQAQPEIALEMGMQGMGYMHSDLGGFANANLDDELYTRWLQYGVFNPVFRPHAQEEVASEPVFRDAKTEAMAKESIALRYSLLPYNYTLAFENNQTGMPLMRPLFYEEPKNDALYNKTDEYFWGNDFLVVPVLEKGQKSKDIYFPKSSNWYGFHSGQKHAGGAVENVPLAEDHIPAFVRGGAFIPVAKPMQTTRDYSLDGFTLHYYYDTDVTESSGKIYNDDGETPNAFEKGKYELLNCSATAGENRLVIKLTPETGASYKSVPKNGTLVIHNPKQNPNVKVNGKTVKVIRNAKTKTLEIPVIWNKTAATVTIQFSAK